MFMLKVFTYCATIAAAMFFAFWELRLKRKLTDGAMSPVERVSDLGIMNDLSERMRREQILRDLPTQARSTLRMVVVFKFAFVAILIAEVIIFQR
jgi:hypothetical protein